MRFATIAATAFAAGAGVGVAPIVLLSAFGRTAATLVMYTPVVTLVIYTGTLLLRLYMAGRTRARALAYSAVSSVIVAALVFGSLWFRWATIENRLSSRSGDFHGWEPEELWDLLTSGWISGFVVSLTVYWLLTRPVPAEPT